MGINYRLSLADGTTIHIGKSSCGWHFGLKIYPDLGIYTFDNWKELFTSHGVTIFDENDRVITPKKMIDIITNRKGRHVWTTTELLENHAELGLNNLAAHKACVVDVAKENPIFKGFAPIVSPWIRTEGTYDYYVSNAKGVNETW